MANQIDQFGKVISQYSCRGKVGVLKTFLFFSFLVLFFSLSAVEESQAEPPKYDPWYYVHDNAYRFTVPDKFQHFYGSAMLTEIIGPMPALAFGFIKEVHDDSEAKVGFSIKDIAADALGVMSAKFAKTKSVKLWLDWDPTEETLVVNFGIRL